MTKFENVSLLITHYNRSSSLERLLSSFEKLDCHFSQVVVSDDGSIEEHINAVKDLQKKYGFQLVAAEGNKGLGNNINKGQDAVTSEYTLYVQEDFVPQRIFVEKFSSALQIMEEREDIDLIRMHAYLMYPYLKPYRDGFSEMKFSIWLPGYKKFSYYSDHPHLRRSSFFDKFGRYSEGIAGDPTEFNMMMSFLKKKGKALFYEDYQAIFKHTNPEEEPSTMSRTFWRETKNPLIGMARHLYRHLKYNWRYLF